MKYILSRQEAVDMLLDDPETEWTPEAAEAIVNIFEEWEEEFGEHFRFNPVAIRCEFTEYADALDALNDIHGNSDDKCIETIIDNKDETAAVEALKESDNYERSFSGGIIVRM